MGKIKANFRRKSFNPFILNRLTKEVRKTILIRMAAEMKSTKNIMGEAMAQVSALDMVDQTGFYQKEEKMVRNDRRAIPRLGQEMHHHVTGGNCVQRHRGNNCFQNEMIEFFL